MKLSHIHIFILAILLVMASSIQDSFAIGGKGPLEGKATGVKNERPAKLDKIGIDENLGGQLDLSLPFKDELGKDIVLGDYFNKGKPVFLMLIYYKCPTLCNTHLNMLMGMLKRFEWNVGEKFDFVTVSIDPEEAPMLAKMKKKTYLDQYGRKGTDDGWHFLTGQEASIKKLASQVGFKYFWDKDMQEWAHTAAAYIITPEGKISYYHYGLDIKRKVLRLSLVEASDNKIGSVMDRVLLYCLQYDPSTKGYTLEILKIMKVLASLTVLLLGGYLGWFWFSQRRKND